MKSATLCSLLVAAMPSLVLAQSGKPTRIYISADMEGIGGVVTPFQVDRTRPEWERFRRFMTEEVVAAIAGAKEAGATEFVVSDSHGSMENLLIELLPEGTSAAITPATGP
jgi:D-amino peptidase